MNAPVPRSRLVADEIISVDPGQRWSAGRPPGRYRLRAFLVANDAGRELVAVCTELMDNPGMSITNAAEHVWRALARRFDSLEFTMVEHYCDDSYVSGREHETFDIVTVQDGEPEWKRIDRSWLTERGIQL